MVLEKILHNPLPRILNLLDDMGSTNKGLLIQRLIIFLGKHHRQFCKKLAINLYEKCLLYNFWHNSCTTPTTFFKLTIGSVFLHVGFKYLMVNLTKSCWVVQELYESCKRIISQICIEVNKKYQWWRKFKNKSERLYWCYCLFHIIIPFTTRQKQWTDKKNYVISTIICSGKKKRRFNCIFNLDFH